MTGVFWLTTQESAAECLLGEHPEGEALDMEPDSRSIFEDLVYNLLTMVRFGLQVGSDAEVAVLDARCLVSAGHSVLEVYVV